MTVRAPSTSGVTPVGNAKRSNADSPIRSAIDGMPQDGPAGEGNGRRAHRKSDDDRRTTPFEERSTARGRPEAAHLTAESSALGSFECPQEVIVVAPDHERALLVADEDSSAIGAQ